MTLFPFTDCCTMLSIDPKTLRQWLKEANMPLQAHPSDARLKCLSSEQLWQLASLHACSIQPQTLEEASHAGPSHGVMGQKHVASSPVSWPEDVQLAEKVAALEAQVVAQQHQLTQLALTMLREQERRFEKRLQTLEALLQQRGTPQLSTAPLQAMQGHQEIRASPKPSQHPTEKRARIPLIPLIEYGANGRYVLICPQAGELHIAVDSSEWFEWLTSLSSFRFVGKRGHFSARRGYNRGPNRCWYAQRGIHQKNYSKYIGVSEHITTERLEQVAAYFQSYLK